ncbi:MAG: hypothetical protein IJD37_05975 [Clostridia bacterium]|nr:hypothetical protein [Clostridia bacterium]
MKKSVLLLIAILTLSVLFSCGNERTNTPDETEKETVGGDIAETDNNDKKEEPKRLSEEEKAKYFKVVEYDLPEGDFREVMVSEMRKYSSIEWVAAESFGINEVIGDNDWTVNLDYKKGTTYKGIPYTNRLVNYEYFESLIVDGKYAPETTKWREAPGMDCWGAIRCAMQQFDPSEGWTADWVPGQKTFSLEMVGDYKAPESPQSTGEICQTNGKDVMFEAYMQLQKGDIVYRKDFGKKDYLHCRVVVEEPTIVKNGAGKIIPSRSFVKCIESTNAFDKTVQGVNTTWFVDHTYSLEALYSTDYVPLTLPIYSKSLSELEVPYIVLDNEITASVLAKGMFSSSVKSNFPLRYVKIEIFDKSGKTVLVKDSGNLQDKYSITLRKDFADVFNDLANGEYTLVLKAGISRGNAELARVDFAYNK